MNVITGEMMNKHERLVFDELEKKYEKINYKRFKKTLNETIEKNAEEIEGFEEIDIHFVPDGFMYNEDEKTCFVFEVENQNPLSKGKLDHMSSIAMDFDYYYWGLHLIIVNRFGHESLYNLYDHFEQKIKRATSRNR